MVQAIMLMQQRMQPEEFSVLPRLQAELARLDVDPSNGSVNGTEKRGSNAKRNRRTAELASNILYISARTFALDLK